MRTSTAFFAGVGTVAIAVAAGLGGGLMIAEGMHPKSPAVESTKLERSVPDTPSPSPTATSYLAATQAAAKGPVKVAPPAADPAATAPSSTTASAQPPAAAVETTAANALPPPPTNTQAGSSEDAQAKMQEKMQDNAATQDRAAERVQDADLKAREAERKRGAEQRRAERHRQFAERRRQRRDQDLRAVEQAVREDSTPRAYAVQPVRMEAPRFSLFGDD